MEPALASLTDPDRLAALAEFALGLDDAADLEAVARAAAHGASRLLGGRGVLVQLSDPTAATGSVSSAAGPEMSAELRATALAGSLERLGEVVLDAGQPLGTHEPVFDALVTRIARAADRLTTEALGRQDREGLLQATSALLQERAGRREGRATRLRAIVQVLAAGADCLDPARVERLVEVAPWIDLVELAVPDGLLARSTDTENEDALLAAHAERGAAAAAFVLRDGGNLVVDARELLGALRERWDGRGGPAGLRGTEIPFGARLLAVADELERRGAHRGISAALERLRQLAGHRLDPELVESALENALELERVFDGWLDGAPDSGHGGRRRRSVA